MNDRENAEMAYATSILGNPLLLPMIMKKVEWETLMRASVRKRHLCIENPSTDVSFSGSGPRRRNEGSGRTVGDLAE